LSSQLTTADLIRQGVLEIGDGYRAKNSELRTSGLPFARAQNLNHGFSFDNADRYPEDALDKVGTKVSRPGDCVFTSKGSVGRVGFVSPQIPQFVYSPQLSYWRTLDPMTLDPQFLRYWLQGPEFARQRDAVKGSTDMADYVNLRDQRQMSITLPKIDAQRRIGAVLSAYDDLIENNNQRVKIVEETTRRIYLEWFVEFRYPGHETVPLVTSTLGLIPEGWTIDSLGFVCELIQAGGTPSRSNEMYWAHGSIDWFKTNELQDAFLQRSSERVTPLALAHRKTRAFPPGTILMAIYGAPTVGRLGVLTATGCCNQAALALRANEDWLTQRFLYYVLLELRSHFNSIAQGAAQQNISKERVAGTVVARPPLHLVRAWDELVRPQWEIKRALTAAASKLREARDLLLPKLISGELDVSDLDITMPPAAE